MELERKQKFDDLIKKMFKNKKIEKVLLVNPPDIDKNLFNFESANRGRNMNYPPYGLGLISSHLELINVQNEFLNLNHIILDHAEKEQSINDFHFERIITECILDKIKLLEPDIIVITCMFSQTHQSLIDTINIIRSKHEIPIAIGGVHVTGSMSEDKTKIPFIKDVNGVDFIFLNESEVSFREFIKYINGKKNEENLTQFVAINRSRKSFIKFEERLTPTGDDLNINPNHKKMYTGDIAKVGKIGGFFSLLSKQKKLSTILSNRGCRAQCTFCSVRNFNGVGVRRRTVDSVIEELKILKFEHGIDHVMWLDDDFLYNKKESLMLFNEMVRNNLNMTFDNTNGVIAASCTEEVMNAAAAAGCIGLTVGMESGNRDILRSIRKPGTVENFLRAGEVLNKIEQINARVFLMIGFPNESFSQIKDTIDVSTTMNLDWYNITILQPLPNTVIFDQMLSEGLIGDISFSEMGYNSGTHGKKVKKSGASRDPLSVDFKNAFSDKKLEEIPDKTDLDNIWAYMNYHLNFRRLFQENRKTKLNQQYKYVRNIADLVAPNNAFAIYFSAFLHHRLYNEIDYNLLDQFSKSLSNNSYWKKRCKEFGLNADHIKSNNYPVIESFVNSNNWQSIR